MNKHIDISWEASKIIMDHTGAFMSGVECNPENEAELYDIMVEECAYLLTTKLLSHEYTPMEYNAIRNELGKQLADVFGYTF